MDVVSVRGISAGVGTAGQPGVDRTMPFSGGVRPCPSPPLRVETEHEDYITVDAMHVATVLQVRTFCNGLPSYYTQPTNLPCLGSAGAAVGVVSA